MKDILLQDLEEFFGEDLPGLMRNMDELLKAFIGMSPPGYWRGRPDEERRTAITMFVSGAAINERLFVATILAEIRRDLTKEILQ